MGFLHPDILTHDAKSLQKCQAIFCGDIHVFDLTFCDELIAHSFVSRTIHDALLLLIHTWRKISPMTTSITIVLIVLLKLQ